MGTDACLGSGYAEVIRRTTRMHLDFAVVADYAIVDQAGKLSVLGIFQHIWVQQFPAMHPRLHLVLRLKGKRTEVGEHHVQIRLLDEQNTEVLGGTGNVSFAEPPAGVTDIEAGAILVFDVPFPHAGAYRFEITIDEDRKAAVPLTVSQLPAQTAGGPGGQTLHSADSAVTVHDLVTMTSGYQWNEDTGDDYNQWISADNHVQYLLDRPHATAPGLTFTYNSAAVHTLGVALQDAAAMPLPQYAAPLFAAIGVDTVAWESLDRGTVNGGAGIALRGRDLLKFGQLFLQRGWSGDRSVVPEAWVDEATRPQFAWRRTFGPLSHVTYGMLWWVSDATPAAFYAWGYGGQFVYVVPSRDVVVVVPTDWNGLSEVTPQALAVQALGVIVNDVVPAAR